MLKPFTKRIDLGAYDPAYKDCFLVMEMMSMNETEEFKKDVIAIKDDAEKVGEYMLELIKRKVKSGRVIDESGEQRDYVPEDLGDFGLEFLIDLASLLKGEQGKKSVTAIHNLVWHNDGSKITDEDSLKLRYYNYIKANPGITFREFLNESSEIVNFVLLVENEISQKQADINKQKK